MVEFLADLKAMFDFFDVSSAVLVGHSLGGHICSRFAALYPHHVTRLVLADGMGPPRQAFEDDDGASIDDARWRDTISMITAPQKERVMQDAEEAKSRLMRNNPRISEDLARLIAGEGVVRAAGGEGVTWSWDDRASMIWMTLSHDESEIAWGEIACPVLIITGDEGLDYWARMRPHLAGEDALYKADLVSKRKLFQDARHVVINQAGHMLHYDQPDRFVEVVDHFLNGPVAPGDG